MIKVSIVGATGLVGEGLIRVLLGHPECELSMLVSEHAAEKSIGDLLPSLRGECDLKSVSATPAEVAKASDVVFSAKKGSESFEWVPGLLEGGAKVIDIGGEFRFQDAGIYERWYQSPHACKDLLAETVYGLPELFRDEIQGARLVGNPGCYVTSAILALAPFVASGLVDEESIIVDSYSGVSGAGRQYSAKQSNLYVDINENMVAYAVGTHKHTPEIEMGLSRLANQEVKVTFVPHLAPLDRGILTTVFARPKEGVKRRKLEGALERFYAAMKAPFVRVLNTVGEVAVANVNRSNYCDVSAQYIERTNQLVIVSALDNLVKGAAGQAVQNLNLMCGLDEKTGLTGRSL